MQTWCGRSQRRFHWGSRTRLSTGNFYRRWNRGATYSTYCYANTAGHRRQTKVQRNVRRDGGRLHSFLGLTSWQSTNQDRTSGHQDTRTPEHLDPELKIILAMPMVGHLASAVLCSAHHSQRGLGSSSLLPHIFWLQNRDINTAINVILRFTGQIIVSC